MDFTEIIFDRRSIRHFKNLPVENQKVEKLLKAAMYAPSAGNKQPWFFIVTDDRIRMNRIIEMHPHAWMLKTAPLAILVCGDENLQHGSGYWLADCGAATENILLAACSIGLGSCWIGLFPRENRMKAITEIFDLPGSVKPFSLIAIGYPDEVKERPARFKPERIFYNRWNNRKE
jgi:nitroreductase